MTIDNYEILEDGKLCINDKPISVQNIYHLNFSVVINTSVFDFKDMRFMYFLYDNYRDKIVECKKISQEKSFYERHKIFITFLVMTLLISTICGIAVLGFIVSICAIIKFKEIPVYEVHSSDDVIILRRGDCAKVIPLSSTKDIVVSDDSVKIMFNNSKKELEFKLDYKNIDDVIKVFEGGSCYGQV